MVIGKKIILVWLNFRMCNMWRSKCSIVKTAIEKVKEKLNQGENQTTQKRTIKKDVTMKRHMRKKSANYFFRQSSLSRDQTTQPFLFLMKKIVTFIDHWRCTLRYETIFGKWNHFKNYEKWFLFRAKSSFSPSDKQFLSFQRRDQMLLCFSQRYWYKMTKNDWEHVCIAVCQTKWTIWGPDQELG